MPDEKLRSTLDIVFAIWVVSMGLCLLAGIVYERFFRTPEQRREEPDKAERLGVSAALIILTGGVCAILIGLLIAFLFSIF